MKQILANPENVKPFPKDIFIRISFEERVSKYNNEITITDFDWREPLGLELI